MKYLPNWVIESWELADEKPHELGDVGVLIDGEFASVVFMSSILTQTDHNNLCAMDKRHRKEKDAYFRRVARWSFLPWRHHDPDGSELKAMVERHIKERDTVYSRGEPYIDGHRFLVVGAPYAYELLCKYRETGTLTGCEVAQVLDIMEGKTPPIVARVERDLCYKCGQWFVRGAPHKCEESKGESAGMPNG